MAGVGSTMSISDGCRRRGGSLSRSLSPLSAGRLEGRSSGLSTWPAVVSPDACEAPRPRETVEALYPSPGSGRQGRHGTRDTPWFRTQCSSYRLRRRTVSSNRVSSGVSSVGQDRRGPSWNPDGTTSLPPRGNDPTNPTTGPTCTSNPVTLLR